MAAKQTNTFREIAGLKKNVKIFTIFHILNERMLHICLVAFISFISYTKFHLICVVPHFHLIDSIDNSPSNSHIPYLFILILCRYSTSLPTSFFNQTRLWNLGVFCEKLLIWNTYYIAWSWIPMILLLLITFHKNHNI